MKLVTQKGEGASLGRQSLHVAVCCAIYVAAEPHCLLGAIENEWHPNVRFDITVRLEMVGRIAVKNKTNVNGV